MKLNFRDELGLSATQKRAAITQRQEGLVSKDLKKLFDKWAWQYHHPIILPNVPGSEMIHFGVTDYDVAVTLWKTHETVRGDYYRKRLEIKDAKAQAAENEVRVKLRKEVKREVLEGITEQLCGQLRLQLMREAKEQLRQELKEELREEVREELKGELRAEARNGQHGK